MFPRYEDHGVFILRLGQLGFQFLDFAEAELRVHRQPAADGGRLDGRERPDIKIFIAVHFLRRVRRENKLRRAVFAEQDFGQRQRAVQSLARQLAESARRLFAVPDANNGFNRRRGIGYRFDTVCLRADFGKCRCREDKENKPIFLLGHHFKI